MTSDNDNHAQPPPPPATHRPEVHRAPPDDTTHLNYRPASADRRDARADHTRRFKKQMWIGTAVGVTTVFTWIGCLMTSPQRETLQFESLLLAAAVIAWATLSAARHRTPGFVAGLVLAVALLALLTGCGVAVLCGPMRF